MSSRTIWRCQRVTAYLRLSEQCRLIDHGSEPATSIEPFAETALSAHSSFALQIHLRSFHPTRLPRLRIRRRSCLVGNDPPQGVLDRAVGSAGPLRDPHILRYGPHGIKAEKVFNAVKFSLFFTSARLVHTLMYSPLERALVQLSRPLLLLDCKGQRHTKHLDMRSCTHSGVHRYSPR